MVTAIFVGGFLHPEGHAPYPENAEGVRVISVYPSGVSSLHDRCSICHRHCERLRTHLHIRRAMQIFYELKGGTVHYGREHSVFHGHDEEGITFEEGKLPEWDEDHPVHLIGHSFGGVTARVLHAYLAEGNRFRGHVTSRNWVISVNTISAPLNGSLMVYSLGANVGFAPVVRWGSLGFCIGILAHILGFIDSSIIKSVHDFKLDYWKLSYTREGSFARLLYALGGYCIHSTTDNAAYDMTIHSQLEWSQLLHSIEGTFYSSIVGTTFQNDPSMLSYLIYALRPYFLRTIPRNVVGIDTNKWMETGFDGLLSARTQEFPFLSHLENFDVNGLPDCPSPKVWYVTYLPSDHLGTISDGWNTIMLSIKTFDANFCKSKNTNPRFGKSSLRPPRLIPPPDMQVPRWQLSERPTIQFSIIYSSFVSTFCAAVILLSDSPPLASVTLIPHLSLSIMTQFSTDTVEVISALARLYVIGLSIFGDNTKFLIYGFCVLADGISCLHMSRAYEYCMPLVKILLGTSILLPETWFLEHSRNLPILRVLDVFSLLAKAAWIIRAENPSEPDSLKWELIWFSFVVSTSHFVYCVCSESLPVTMITFYLVFALTRLRDISDAFQVECILNTRRKGLRSRKIA